METELEAVNVLPGREPEADANFARFSLKMETTQREFRLLGCSNYALPLGGYRKRAFDLAGSIFAILILSPLIGLIVALIKISDGGPVIFRHRRIGINGSYFNCFKFRTMAPNSDFVLHKHLLTNKLAREQWETIGKIKNDPRITPLGRVLRKTSLDELPQLLNILKGEMSFVGPRPIVEAEIVKYGTGLVSYMRARPGLTGAWQVGGRNDTEYSRRVDFDCDYVENWTFWRDLWIIAKTFVAVATSRGCY